MLECPSVKKEVIRGHYDLSTPFYRLLWGQHIHHGLWNDSEPAKQAQVQLTETMADLAGIQGGERLLDVGCGMGGSSIHLARTRQCQSTGVTISRLQRSWAATSAFLNRVKSRTTFLHADAEEV
ncbi:MAG: class I SAM-dependent methyltransferase, partial [Planctomycetaceae bacterium]|nr:class I SAM-dependent methyltransferase [Planctomycetaceae bacterium]